MFRTVALVRLGGKVTMIHRNVIKYLPSDTATHLNVAHIYKALTRPKYHIRVHCYSAV